jgi:hypothetical protein
VLAGGLEVLGFESQCMGREKDHSSFHFSFQAVVLED